MKLRLCIRYRIKCRIAYHERVRQNLIYYSHPHYTDNVSWNRYVEAQEELWKQAAWHYRFSDRLKQLLNKHK